MRAILLLGVLACVSGCSGAVNPMAPAPVLTTTTITVHVLDRSSHQPIGIASVTHGHESAIAVNHQGDAIVTVPLGLETCVTAEAPSYAPFDFPVCGTVNGPGEGWTFYLERLI